MKDETRPAGGELCRHIIDVWAFEAVPLRINREWMVWCEKPVARIIHAPPGKLAVICNNYDRKLWSRDEILAEMERCFDGS